MMVIEVILAAENFLISFGITKRNFASNMSIDMIVSTIRDKKDLLAKGEDS